MSCSDMNKAKQRKSVIDKKGARLVSLVTIKMNVVKS